MRPSMVHIHGFAISGRYLMPTAWRLAPEFRTYVPDLPGLRSQRAAAEAATTSRRSPPRSAGSSTTSGVERVTLLGNSLGCPIIGDFVDQFPDRVERAIFVGPGRRSVQPPDPARYPRSSTLAALREPLGMAPIASEDYLRYGPDRLDRPPQVDAPLPHGPAARRDADAGARGDRARATRSISESVARREGRRRSRT